jgi:hypothetical protein
MTGALQLFIALGVLNVWLLRFNKPTAWRGGNAQNMREEFRVYGLSDWICTAVGVLKITSALLLFLGLWFPVAAQLGASVLAVLMLGAVVMHVKVADPVRKALPSFCMFILCVIVALLNG